MRLIFPRSFALLAVMVGLIFTTAAFADDKELSTPDLPVKRVVMFSSGVAFYEHQGEVDGNATVDLKFNVRDINDLLKSMVLQDLGGGRISSVSYAAKEPITRTLQTFAIDLTANPTLADLLHQVRGEKVEIEAPTKVAGTIIGVEFRQVASGKGEPVHVPYLNLLTDDGLRSVSLENVGKIKLSNPKLDAELRQALLALATAKNSDKKGVELNFLGEGKRRVRVGYVQESPIWKTSYRLVLNDEEKPLLQGWAIVENTTEADWDNVELTLISGRPISFVMDLYQPLYMNRPKVVPEMFSSLRPRSYDQDLAAAEAEFRKAGKRVERPFVTQAVPPVDEKAKSGDMPMGMGMGGMGGMGGGGLGGGFPGGSGMARGASTMPDRLLKQEGEGQAEAWNLARGGQSVANASDAGEMFRYEIATPVTLARSKSAMLPIVNETVSGEKLVIYNESQHPKHPLHGFRLKNTTDLHLMQGPITVFDENSYAGDAQIQDLSPGSQRLVSYAMDLDTEVAITGRQEATNLVSLQLKKGNAIVTQRRVRSREYTAKNSGKRNKKVLIEYPIEANWTLVTPKEPVEKTRDLYRFALDANPGEPVKLEVKEEFVASQTVGLANWDQSTIAFYTTAKETSNEVKQALAEVVKQKTKLDLVLAQQQELERQIKVIQEEQGRIRGNIAELAKDSDLYRRYESKLTKQEDDIDRLREDLTETIKQEHTLRQALDNYLLGLDVK